MLNGRKSGIRKGLSPEGYLAQTNTFTVQDSATMTSKHWRDTCFALLDLSPTQVPSGYLLDYALTAFNDSNFNSLVNSNIDTLLNPGSFLMLHSILNSDTHLLDILGVISPLDSLELKM